MKKIIYTLITVLVFLGVQNTFSQNDFHIIPEAKDTNTVTKAVETVGSAGGKVRDTYNQEAKNLELSEQLASGIMTRDTLLDYIVYLAKFLSQIGLVIGAIMIIYAGYLYASYVFTSKEPSKDPLKNAIIGTVVIAFSYAIMKILTSAFIS